MQAIKITAVTIVLAALTYYAAAGVACLHMTTPAISNRDECDVVYEQNGRSWCMTLITEELSGKIPVKEAK